VTPRGSVCVSILADAAFADCARESVLSVLESSSFDVHLSLVGVRPKRLPATPRLLVSELGASGGRRRERAWPFLRKFWALERCLARTDAERLVLLDADTVLVRRLEDRDIAEALSEGSLGMVAQETITGSAMAPADFLEHYVRHTLAFISPGEKPPPPERFTYFNSGVVLGTRAELESLCSWATSAIASAGRPHAVGKHMIADQDYFQYWAHAVAPDRTVALPWSWNHSALWHEGFPRPDASILHFSNFCNGPARGAPARMRTARRATESPA
jgi:hypothetical protein